MKEMNKVCRKILRNKSSICTAAKMSQRKVKRYNRTLLVPVATIGCGKTTLSLALSKLFSFGHIQNDDIVGVGKKSRNKFYRKVNREFDNRDVVIADRNNHVRELRKTLIEAVKKRSSNVRIVAIYWNHESRTPNEIFQITSKRIITRGANHQSLTAENQKFMWGFLNKFERFDWNNSVDGQFDHIINLDVANDIKTNLGIVIDELKSIIGIKNPSEDVIENVLKEIERYKPIVHKFVDDRSTSEDDAVKEIKHYEPTRWATYYGITLGFNFQDFLTKYYKEHPNEDSRTFKILVQENRIGSEHHVTLIHCSELKKGLSNEKQELWKRYRKMCEGSPQKVKVYIDKIVYNPQIMALIVNRMEPPTIRSTNRIAHITVGTVHKSIKPFQSNSICESALFGYEKRPEIRVINLEQELVVKGTVRAFQ